MRVHDIACHAILCYGTLSSASLFENVLFNAILCETSIRYATLRHAMLLVRYARAILNQRWQVPTETSCLLWGNENNWIRIGRSAWRSVRRHTVQTWSLGPLRRSNPQPKMASSQRDISLVVRERKLFDSKGFDQHMVTWRYLYGRAVYAINTVQMAQHTTLTHFVPHGCPCRWRRARQKPTERMRLDKPQAKHLHAMAARATKDQVGPNNMVNEELRRVQLPRKTKRTVDWNAYIRKPFSNTTSTFNHQIQSLRPQ